MSDILLWILTASGPISAILAALLTNRYAEKRFEKQRRDRLLAELVSTRFKALQELNAGLIDCYSRLHRYGNSPPQTKKEFDRYVSIPMKRFENSLIKHSIWLDSQAFEILKEAIGSFRHTMFAILLKLPPSQLFRGLNPQSYPSSVRNIDWGKLSTSFERAQNVIRVMLAVPEVEEYVKSVLSSKKRGAITPKR